MGKFLILIPGGGFVLRVDDDAVPVCVPTPSTALHLDYWRADEGCQFLRRLGHQAVVCDIFGTEADIDVIQRGVVLQPLVPTINS